MHLNHYRVTLVVVADYGVAMRRQPTGSFYSADTLINIIRIIHA